MPGRIEKHPELGGKHLRLMDILQRDAISG